MRFRSRKGSALLETALVIPLLFLTMWGFATIMQMGLWKMAAEAAAGAGAQVLAEGSSPFAAKQLAFRALKAPIQMNPMVSAWDFGQTGTVTVSLTVLGPIGPVRLTAQRSVALFPTSQPQRGFVP